jgi:peptide/nickel transport system ATP-binding protein
MTHVRGSVEADHVDAGAPASPGADAHESLEAAGRSPVLAVEGLRTHFFTRAGVLKAVDDVSFAVHRGEVLGLVGESGSGKSMTAYSIMGLVDAPGRVVGGRILLDGRDLRDLAPEAMRRVRGNRIAMIFQDPMMTLNPVLRIDVQMIEAIRAHRDVPKATARARAREALVKVGIASPDERLDAYPHQFSGGMRQRVAIAIALLNEPDVIIADEPTTALDVTIQGQILHEMQRLARDAGLALVWITHDLSVIAGLADRVCVMYAGRIVEQGHAADVLARPRHPYTRGLIDSVPARNARGSRLRQIPGMAPSLAALPAGCAFRERCARPVPACAVAPAMQALAGPGQSIRCHHPLADEDA